MDESFRNLLVDEIIPQHIAFLRGLHRLGVTTTTTFRHHHRASDSMTAVSRMLHRYLDLWLPLVAATGAQPIIEKSQQKFSSSSSSSSSSQQPPLLRLIPPPDIAWLWHCHRLAPLSYEKYVQDRFGYLVEANPSFAFQQQEEEQPDDTATTDDDDSSLATIQAWYARYPDEPFFMSRDANNVNHDEDDVDEDSTSLLNQNHNVEYQRLQQEYHFDLLASAQSQSTFLWHITRPHYQNRAYLVDGMDRYVKFIQLSRVFMIQKGDDDHNNMIVPTFQIDLVWHSHILWSIAHYHATCQAIRGCNQKFHHDDSFNERGGALDVAFYRTAAEWEKLYNGMPYAVDGAMYQGEPPESFFDQYKDWDPDVCITQQLQEQKQSSSRHSQKKMLFQTILVALVGLLISFLVYSWEEELEPIFLELLPGWKHQSRHHHNNVMRGAC